VKNVRMKRKWLSSQGLKPSDKRNYEPDSQAKRKGNILGLSRATLAYQMKSSRWIVVMMDRAPWEAISSSKFDVPASSRMMTCPTCIPWLDGGGGWRVYLRDQPRESRDYWIGKRC
jgi:hypothetical protein